MKAAAADALATKSNQYPPMLGVPELRQAVAAHAARHSGQRGVSADGAGGGGGGGVLVTSGATEGIAAALAGLCNRGDRAVVFEPLYDAYAGAAAAAGVELAPVRLRPPAWALPPPAFAGADGPEAEAEAAAAEAEAETAEEAAAAEAGGDDGDARVGGAGGRGELGRAFFPGGGRPHAKLVILNTPHNPTGKVFSRAELARVAAFVRRAGGCLALLDEVYEHLVHPPPAAEEGDGDKASAGGGADDGVPAGGGGGGKTAGAAGAPASAASAAQTVAAAAAAAAAATDPAESAAAALPPPPHPHEHVSLCTLPGMNARCVRLGSAGKTFSFTGWKVGWATGPDRLLAPMAKAHQFFTFTVPPALQHAVAHGLDRCRPFYEGLGRELAAQRRALAPRLAAIGFGVLPATATYFLVADARAFASPCEDDAAFCRRLAAEGGVALIPVSAFYLPTEETGRPAPPRALVRFAFCKSPEALDAAVGRLEAYLGRPGRPGPGARGDTAFAAEAAAAAARGGL